MGNRPNLPVNVEQAILVDSARRCCLCYGLNGDFSEQKGQIAHLDGDNSNNKPDNLAFLCLPHHDTYDGKTSQSKNYTMREAKHYRAKLYTKVASGSHLFPSTTQPVNGLEIVDLDFMESRNERHKQENRDGYSSLLALPGGAEYLKEWVEDPVPKAGEMPVLDVKLRNASAEPVFMKKAVFRVKQVWPLAPFRLCFSHVNVSANYNVRFPDQPPPYTVEVPLSQCVPPKGVDRFTLTLRPEVFAQIALATVELVYNADSKILVAGDILFALLEHDYEFRTLDAEKLSQESDEPSKTKYVLNNTATAEVKTIRAVRSNVVRAFEAGEL